MPTATATKPKPVTLTGKQTQAMPTWRCQFCVNGHHRSCPGAVRRTDAKGRTLLWICKCPAEDHPGLHCLECKHDRAEDLDAVNWRCLDRHECATILQRRRENDRIWQMIQAAKSRSAIAKRAKRLGVEVALSQIDTTQDATVERVHGMLDAIEQVRGASKPKRTQNPGPPRPKSGKCECCGEATRGGRFLPGHDAKLASTLRERVVSGDKEAYAEMQRRGWLSKLPEKLRGGV
jgi:hypothetical protein